MHFVINNRWALGDTVCLSAMVRDFAHAYGDRHKLTITGHYSRVFWRNNPYVSEMPTNGTHLKLQYVNGMKEAKNGAPIHFVSWFHREMKRLANLDVPVRFPKGDIHLMPHEKRRMFDGRYWVVFAGGKLDMTAKWWIHPRWQQVVDRLRMYGVSCVQGGAHMSSHIHLPLSNCINATNMTRNERDLFTLIHGAEGVICGVTGPMHIAAAFDKPCVVLAGGREPPAWEAYVNDFNAFGPNCEPVKMPHRFLHTIGLLPCTMAHGCLKNRTVAIDRADLSNPEKRAKLCDQPIRTGAYSVPACMDLITVDHVVEAVMSYYEEGRLPPITNPKGTYPDQPVCQSMPMPPLGPNGRPIAGGVTKATVQDALNILAHTPPEPPLVSAADVAAAKIMEPFYDGKLGETHDLPQAFARYGMRQLPDTAPSRIPHNVVPVEVTPEQTTEDPEFQLLDDPVIGGKFTVFILSHGDQYEFFLRCLDSVVNTLPRHRRDIRVALNHPSDRLRQYAQARVPGDITKLYIAYDQRRKYPAMRKMFYDPDCPIETKYLVWCDDDTYQVDRLWAVRLAETIIPNHRVGARLFGKRCLHDLQLYARDGHNPRAWFESAPWWRARPLRLRGQGDRVAPNGSCIEFVAGWFWAAHVESLKQSDVPDIRLNHNGGDITIGAQMTQAGFKVKDFNQDKRYIYTPPKEQGGRRGYSEAFPWVDEKTKAKHKPGT